jgi:hypothetical protein
MKKLLSNGQVLIVGKPSLMISPVTGKPFKPWFYIVSETEWTPPAIYAGLFEARLKNGHYYVYAYGPSGADRRLQYSIQLCNRTIRPEPSGAVGGYAWNQQVRPQCFLKQLAL